MLNQTVFSDPELRREQAEAIEAELLALERWFTLRPFPVWSKQGLTPAQLKRAQRAAEREYAEKLELLNDLRLWRKMIQDCHPDDDWWTSPRPVPLKSKNGKLLPVVLGKTYLDLIKVYVDGNWIDLRLASKERFEILLAIQKRQIRSGRNLTKQELEDVSGGARYVFRQLQGMPFLGMVLTERQKKGRGQDVGYGYRI